MLDEPEEKREEPEAEEPRVDPAELEMRVRSRRSFLQAAGATALGLLGWRWLHTRRQDDGIPWPLRRVLEINEDLARDFFKPSRLARTFSPSLAETPKVNGEEGMDDPVDLRSWKLHLEGSEAVDEMALTMDDIRALPRIEMVTELKCVEGWSKIVRWAGARFADFAEKYPPGTKSGNPANVRGNPDDLYDYVYMETPGGGYYVGLDMPSMLHPQTLLCYEMNGKPLSDRHGAPLRLVIPVKYGYKHIKRIGLIRYTPERPADYWAEQGYDWYAGH